MLSKSIQIKPVSRRAYLQFRITQTKKVLAKEPNLMEKEILLAKLKDLETEHASLCPLEEMCQQVPWAIECKMFDT